MQRKDTVRAFTGQTKELQGPDGVCPPQTYRDLSVILRFLERLKKSFEYVNANYAEAFRLSSLRTFYVENFFSEMRQGNDMPLVLQFCYRFSSCVKERLKSSTKCGFIYFTSDRHYYTKEEGNLYVNELPKFTKPKQNRVITKAQIDELRNWRAEYGQNVRQATVGSHATKDKPGTLSMIYYKFKPDEPQHVDFSNLKALRISKEKSAQPDKQRSIIYPKGAVAVVKKSAAVQGHTEPSEFYLTRLKEGVNNLEFKAKVLLFTQDPLLLLQFLAADKLLTIDAVNIL